MGKNQSASGLTNIIQYDNNGNVSFVSGSTTLMQISSSGAITTTGVISGSNALSSSYSLNSGLLNGTGSVGFATTASLLTVSSSQQQISASQQQLSSSFLILTASYTALSSSYIALSASYNTFSGSNSEILTAVSSSNQQLSASYIALSGSYNTFSGSASTRVTQIEQVYATTGSNSFRATQSITGSLTVTGQIIAQTLNVQQVTSSIIYSSGSNNFGCDLNSRQTFTGSVLVTGSLTIAGASSATSYSGTTIFGSTIACSPIGCFATSCATAFIGGTMSGTTIYGSTAVCSPVGLFSGCVGIGTNSVTYKLDIHNGSDFDIRLKDTSLGGTVGILFETANDFSGTSQSYIKGIGAGNSGVSQLIFGTAGGSGDTTATERMRITSTGIACFACQVCAPSFIGGTMSGTTIYGSTAVCSPVGLFSGCVGIGTASPSYKLEIYRGSSGVVLNLQGVDAYDAETGILFTSSRAKISGFLNSGGGTPGSSLRFYTMPDDGSVTERLRINSDGIACFAATVCVPTLVATNCINIGTTVSLGSRLSIQSANDQAGITMYNSYDCNKWSLRTGTVGVSNKGFAIVDDICNATRIQINGAGNVGIGTTAPSAILHTQINSSSGTEVKGLILQNVGAAANTAVSLIFSPHESTSSPETLAKIMAIRTALSGAPTDLVFYTYNFGLTERMRITSAGITCFGFTVCAPCFATISDYRMKSNVRPIEGLSIIMNTKPYKFEYNYDCSTSFGMIAHELQEIIPEAVFGYKDGETMQGVDYMKLLPIAIKAIQEQQCKIALLESCLGIA